MHPSVLSKWELVLTIPSGVYITLAISPIYPLVVLAVVLESKTGVVEREQNWMWLRSSSHPGEHPQASMSAQHLLCVLVSILPSRYERLVGRRCIKAIPAL